MENWLKAGAFGLFAVGVVGAGLGTADFLDARVSYCNTLTNPCTLLVKVAWEKVPVKAKFEKFIPGAAGQKIFGAALGVVGFSGCMMLSRLLASLEPLKQQFKTIADADTLRRYNTRIDADFQAFTHHANLLAAEVAYAVLEPYQPPLLEGDSLEDITSPSNKVTAGDVPRFEEPSNAITTTTQTDDTKQPSWVKGFISSTCLVWGNQGSGKSWFVRYLSLLKKQMGYKVIVFDPNSNRSEWIGVELFNTYEQIQEKMQWYVDEVMGRYESFGKSNISEQEWRAKLWQQGKAITVICEEMTTYADFISDKELLAKFVKVATTLSRKQEMPICFVTHNNTQSCMGEIKGLANLIGRMQQIQLLPTTDQNTSQPIASGKALIKMDGSDQWVEVVTPKLSQKIKDFRQTSERNNAQRNYLERTWDLEFDVGSKSARTPKHDKDPSKLSPTAQKIFAWLKQNRADGSWLKYKGKEGRDGNFINFLSDFGADWKARDIAIQELLIAELIVVDDEKGMRLIG